MSTTAPAERWVRVTRRDPCPICGKPSWCEASPDGAIAGCMRIRDGSFKTADTAGGPMYLHRLRDDRPLDPAPRPILAASPARPDFDIPGARATYAVAAEACIAALTDEALAELCRRFGPTYGPDAAREFAIGYCEPGALIVALDAAGRRAAGAAAGLVWPGSGEVARDLAGRLVVPYRRGGGTWDLRFSGIKARGQETKEISLRGSYAARGVDGLFFNHDALDSLPEGGTIHLAGGAWKAIALALSGLPALGTRGEGELTDGQLAALVAADVAEVVLHVDAEDPKDGQELSIGRQLALRKAERLALAGLRVRVAEPAREPGTPKVDPDALLRDFGPRPVRAYALSAPTLEAWRVAIGVQAPGVPAEVAEEMEALRQKAADAQRALTSYLRIGSNKHIKAQRDSLRASAVHMLAEWNDGRTTPEGRIRQPLRIVAEAVGKENKTVVRHLKVGDDEGLYVRELLQQEIVRSLDEDTGEVQTTLRLIDPATHRVVEECPADRVFGPSGVPDYLLHRGPRGDLPCAYYVTPKHDPKVILDILVTLDPARIDPETGEEQASWGGRRDTCASCGSQNTHREVRVVCDDCGHTSKPISVDNGMISPVPAAPTPAALAPEATYPSPIPIAADCPAGPEEDDRDGWDPFGCNYPGCTAPLKLGQRYCDFHREKPLARRRFGSPEISEQLALGRPPGGDAGEDTVSVEEVRAATAATLAAEARRTLATIRAQLPAIAPGGFYEVHTGLGFPSGTPVATIDASPRQVTVRTAGGDELRLPAGPLESAGEVLVAGRRFARGAHLATLLRQAEARLAATVGGGP